MAEDLVASHPLLMTITVLSREFVEKYGFKIKI
jgi:hypothetical protein